MIRAIQELRKEANLTVKDVVALEVGEEYENAGILKKNKNAIMKTTGLSDIIFISGNASPHLHNSGIRHS